METKKEVLERARKDWENSGLKSKGVTLFAWMAVKRYNAILNSNPDPYEFPPTSPAQTFEITNEQQEQLNNWLVEISSLVKEHCIKQYIDRCIPDKLRRDGYFNKPLIIPEQELEAKLEYRFRNGAIGHCVEVVETNTKERIDLTDYDRW